MAQKHSQNKSKRDRLDTSRARLREMFSAGPAQDGKLKGFRPETVLAQAWELANDIEEFVRKYLPHYMVDQETQQPIEPAAFHKELYKFALTLKRAAIAAPREHAKSTVVSLFFALYCICHKLRKFIVLISDTESQAILLLGAIKAELEVNDELRKDFGDLVNTRKWDEKDILTVTGIRVSARGAGQSMRGLRQRQFRPDLVICDDLENDEHIDSVEYREKLKRWFKNVVLNLGKNCQVFVIGTILHYDSLLSALLDPDQFPKFTKRLFEAVDEEWTEGSVLWPAKWPLDSLQAKEEDIGVIEFDQEFRNRPLNKATQQFQEDWVKQHAYTMADIEGKQLTKITGIDPAISEKQKADFFGSVTIGVDRKGFIYVLRAEGKKFPFTEQVKFIVSKFDAEKPAAIGIESVAYQRALKQRIDEVGRETRRYIPAREVEAKGDKFTRIASNAPLVENGTIRFRLDGSMSGLLKQLYFLGKTKDDIADAWDIAIRVARESLGMTSSDFTASEASQSWASAEAYA